MVHHIPQSLGEGQTDVSGPNYPTTPDGCYLAVRGRLWRTSNPALASDPAAATLLI